MDNTLLIVAGTNGVLLGHRGLWGDGHASAPPNMFEEVVGVPLFWNWAAGVPPGAVRPEVVSLCDVSPTICELTGAPVPAGPSSGRSIVNAVLGRKYPKKKPWRNRAYAALDDTAHGAGQPVQIRILTREQSPMSCTISTTTPRSGSNTADDPEFIGVRADLTRELNNWK